MLRVGEVRAQGIASVDELVQWTTTVEPATAEAGEQVELIHTATIAGGWKMYALDSPPPSRAVTIGLDALPAGITVADGPWQAAPDEGYDPNFDIDVRTFEREARIGHTLDAEAAGTHQLTGTITFMICTSEMCLPPTPRPFTTSLMVEAAQDAPSTRGSLPMLGGNAFGSGTQVTGDEVRWRVYADPEAVAPGGQAALMFEATIADGWKIYATDTPAGLPFTVSPSPAWPSGLVPNGAVTQQTPDVAYDPNFEEDTHTFSEQALFGLPVQVTAGAIPGDHRLDGDLKYMVCNDQLCIPQTERFEATLTVVPLEAPAAGTSASSGLWGFLLLAAGAGLAALLTPCVFPMIPLTVSYFTKHAGTRREAVQMASVYGLAIVATFTGLGILMALLVGAAGAQSIAANPWVNLLIGLTFVVFALSLLGLFELRAPTGLMNYVNTQGTTQAGYTGVVFMGLTLTLVSFSCTVPFVGGLLAATAAGSWGSPVLGMLVFSSVFAFPFVLFALFPRGLQSLPKSGAWMQAVKVTLGFVELAAAIKFLSNADLVWGTNLISRSLAIALTVVIFAVAGFYLLGKLQLKDDVAVERLGVGRLFGGMGFLGLSVYLLSGLYGAPLGALDAYLPPQFISSTSSPAMASTNSTVPSLVGDGWIKDDIERAFIEAEAQSKPLFIDFTGYTCTNCRSMEANVFPKPPVAERLAERFVLLKVFTDDLDRMAEFQQFQLDLTQTVALPTYAIVEPATRTRLVQHSGMASVEEFAGFLDDGIAAFERQQATLATR
ncbi:MAG: protein-disulfide reductase DsbD domain-containing protein [Bacteroidota bacterium]